MSGVEMSAIPGAADETRLLAAGEDELEYKTAPPEDIKGMDGRYLAGDIDDGMVVKKKKKKRKPRVTEQKKVEVTLEHIERRLAKSFVVKTEKKSFKDIRISIDPRSNFMKRWDVVMMLCLVFTAIVTPYEIAFLAEDTDTLASQSVTPLFWINRVVDLLFFVDMIINFFLGFFDEDENQWVFENKRIIIRYMTGWWSIDLISILPFEFLGEAFGSDALSNLKILRVVRLLRLIKLVRVFRASRLVKRFELSMEMSYSNLSLIKFLVLVAISVHWIACAWQLGPTMEDAEENWLTSMDLQESSAFDRYVTCVYVAIIALPMGVGDIVPITTAERFLCIFMMLIGGSIYAYVIGAICGVVSTRDPATTEFHQTMDHLNTFLSEINTPQTKRREIREYFHHCRQLFRAEYYNALLLQMSPKLRGEVALHCHREWVEQIEFFKAESDEERQNFITSIALSLNLEAYAPKELIINTGEFTEKMYIIQRGLVARLGRVLGAGRFFGEDVILHNSRRNYFVRVLTYLDVYSLSKDDLEEILEKGDFPQTRKIIRKAAIRLALTREFCRIADQVRMARMLGRRLSAINLPTAVVGESMEDGLTPRQTSVSEAPPGRRPSMPAAAQSSVLELGSRLGKLEEKMGRLVAHMEAGFEQLQRVAIDPYATHSTPPLVPGATSGAGSGAGRAGARGALSPLAGARSPAAAGGASLNALWDSLEGDSAARSGDASRAESKRP